VVVGDEQDGSFVPRGTLTSGEHGTYKSLATDLAFNRNTLLLNLRCNGIESALQRTVLQIQPKATAGPAYINNTPAIFVPVDTTNNLLPYEFELNTTGTKRPVRVRTLIRDDGVGGDEDVPEGLYTTTEISTYIAHTMNNPTSVAGTISCSILPNDDKLQVTLVSTNAADTNYNLCIHADAKRNLWRDLGFTKDSCVAPTGGPTTWITISNKPPPVFRYPDPAENGGLRRLYYRDSNGLGFKTPAAHGFQDDDGNPLGSYIRVGKEIMKFTQLNNASVGGLTFPYLVIAEREAFGSEGEEIYVEWKRAGEDLKNKEISQGLCFEDTTIFRVILYLLLGGSGVFTTNHATYDKGWYGSSVFIPSELIDVPSFETLNQLLSPVRSFAIFKRDKLTSVLEQELRLSQTMIVVRSDKLSLVETRPPIRGEAADHVLDSSVYRTDKGLDVDRSHNKIINQIDWKAAFDHGAQKFWLDDGNSVHVTSITSYGTTDALPIEIRSIFDIEIVKDLMKDLASALFAAFSDPYETIELVSTNKESWAYEAGDIVDFSHNIVPALDAVSRGVSVLARVMRKSDKLRGSKQDATRGVLTIMPTNVNGAVWASSVYLSSGSGTSWTASDHKYSGTDDDEDWKRLKAGYKVRAFNPGNETTTQTATVAATPTTSSITFDAPGITLTAPVVIEWVDYDDVGIAAGQLNELFLGDGAGEVDSDPSYRYV
jgi:hypothetical protein